MSIKSDEPFEIPVFLRNPTNRGGLRLPRTTEFRMKDEEPAPDADTDASPDVYAGEGSPMAPVSVLAPSHRLRAVLMPVAAFAVAMSAAVFVVRLPAFEALVSGRVAHASAPAQSAKSEPSPSSFLQSALTAAAANPPEAPAPWSHQAAQLQRDGLDDPATPPAPASVAVPIVAPSPEPLAATLVADAPVAARCAEHEGPARKGQLDADAVEDLEDELVVDVIDQVEHDVEAEDVVQRDDGLVGEHGVEQPSDVVQVAPAVRLREEVVDLLDCGWNR